MVCHLIVYNSIEDWEIITVHRSKEYWEKKFLKLETFWNESLLPEILNSRVARNMEIKEPVSVKCTTAQKPKGSSLSQEIKRGKKEG